MCAQRTSGILLHPTSLPGPGGIGELGSQAFQFVDWLHDAQQTYWQLLPVGPTGYGDSPYTSLSSLAGNPLLISLERLVHDGWLPEGTLADAPDFPAGWVDFGTVIDWKMELLWSAFIAFRAGRSSQHRSAFYRFCTEQAEWLELYALFAALKAAHGKAPWNEWGKELAPYQPEQMTKWRSQLADQIEFHSFLQWIFFRQWHDLKRYAHERGVFLIGDLPFFVAYDSVDVWAHPSHFALDLDGAPTVVAGVPPDDFSETGQRWGNPIYRWDILAQDGFRWWIERFCQLIQLVDVVRLDHFRGFESYWEVPAQEATAVHGRWVKGPGLPLFNALREAVGSVPIIAEDLGLITPEVESLRQQLNFPGMAVLQFAWDGDATHPYLPHNYYPQLVVYTGTHDNDTTTGWWNTLNRAEREHAQSYLGRNGETIAYDMMRLAMMSVAETVILPLQDVLGLGSEARMNRPGSIANNWRWRVQPRDLTPASKELLRDLTCLSGRAPQRETPILRQSHGCNWHITPSQESCSFTHQLED